MPIPINNIHTQLLFASAETSLGLALRSIRTREAPQQWFVLIALDQGQYAVLAADQLQELASGDEQAPLASVVRPSPLVDSQAELESLAPLANQTGYLVVLRDGEVWGVVVRRRPGSVLGERGLEADPGPDALQTLPQRKDRYVNTDLVADAAPEQALSRNQPLEPGTRYYLRLGIGQQEASSLEVMPSSLPAEILQEDIELDVVVFSEDVALEATHGVLAVPANGITRVRRPASQPEGWSADTELLQERLLFGFQTPTERGVIRLRCNLYCRGVLLQSRLISAAVGPDRTLENGLALAAVLDFTISPAMTQELLQRLRQHSLSLMVNSMDDGSQTIRVVGRDGERLFASSATLGEGEINHLISLTRDRLREVAWGDKAEWSKQPYRYESSTAAQESMQRLRDDLISMARRGYAQYSAVIETLVGGRKAVRQLEESIRKPGLIQLAQRRSAHDIVPIAMFYDAPIDTGAALSLCPDFEASLTSGRPLIDEPCFQGECKHYDNLEIVCPSGFWGLRHDIGIPFPVELRGPELALCIPYTGQPGLNVAAYRDFPAWKKHEAALQQWGYVVAQASDRAEVLKLLKASQPQLVYFYCHGVERDSLPFIRVGSEQSDDYLAPDNLRAYRIDWEDARPLVFLNGCHTAALTPERALSFVRTFVEQVGASGVIGTEITIFEPLAQRFAELFCKRFLEGIPLGRAMREARLGLLAERNPLGLVYIGHAYADLALVKS